jgi:hypothetical protein
MVVAPTIDKMVQPCAATIIEEELELVAPFLPINRHQERKQRERVVSVCKRVERKKELQWQQLQVQQ